MRRKNIAMTKNVIRQLVFYFSFLVVWQCVFYIGANGLRVWKPYAFPNPLGVWESLVSLISSHTAFITIFTSLKRAFIGFALSIIIGVGIGLLLTVFEYLRRTVKPLILGIQTLPSICWVPFAILWFGLKESAVIFVIVMGSSFSIAIAVDSAIRNVNPLFIKAAKTMGAKGHQLYFKVIFPASLPALISGLKQGWSFAWRALMSAEVMSTSIGLGQALIMGRDLADINRVTLITLIIVLIGVLIDRFVFGLAEDKILKRMGY